MGPTILSMQKRKSDPNQSPRSIIISMNMSSGQKQMLIYIWTLSSPMILPMAALHRCQPKAMRVHDGCLQSKAKQKKRAREDIYKSRQQHKCVINKHGTRQNHNAAETNIINRKWSAFVFGMTNTDSGIAKREWEPKNESNFFGYS